MKEPANSLRAIHRDLHHFILKGACFRKSISSRVIKHAKQSPALIIRVEACVQVVGPVYDAVRILVIKQNGAAVYIA